MWHIVARPHWVDHFKNCVLNLRYARTGRAKNAKNLKGMPLPMYSISNLTIFSSVHDSKFKVQQAHFHVQSIKASPVMIACKTAKLFTFFTDQLIVDVL